MHFEYTATTGRVFHGDLLPPQNMSPEEYVVYVHEGSHARNEHLVFVFKARSRCPVLSKEYSFVLGVDVDEASYKPLDVFPVAVASPTEIAEVRLQAAALATEAINAFEPSKVFDASERYIKACAQVRKLTIIIKRLSKSPESGEMLRVLQEMQKALQGAANATQGDAIAEMALTGLDNLSKGIPASLWESTISEERLPN